MPPAKKDPYMQEQPQQQSIRENELLEIINEWSEYCEGMNEDFERHKERLAKTTELLEQQKKAEKLLRGSIYEHGMALAAESHKESLECKDAELAAQKVSYEELEQRLLVKQGSMKVRALALEEELREERTALRKLTEQESCEKAALVQEMCTSSRYAESQASLLREELQNSEMRFNQSAAWQEAATQSAAHQNTAILLHEEREKQLSAEVQCYVAQWEAERTITGELRKQTLAQAGVGRTAHPDAQERAAIATIESLQNTVSEQSAAEKACHEEFERKLDSLTGEALRSEWESCRLKVSSEEMVTSLQLAHARSRLSSEKYESSLQLAENRTLKQLLHLEEECDRSRQQHEKDMNQLRRDLDAEVAASKLQAQEQAAQDEQVISSLRAHAAHENEKKVGLALVGEVAQTNLAQAQSQLAEAEAQAWQHSHQSVLLKRDLLLAGTNFQAEQEEVTKLRMALDESEASLNQLEASVVHAGASFQIDKQTHLFVLLAMPISLCCFPSSHVHQFVLLPMPILFVLRPMPNLCAQE